MMFAAEDDLPPAGVTDTGIKGFFKYLPRTIPIDYEKEMKSYIEAMEVIRTAA